MNRGGLTRSRDAREVESLLGSAEFRAQAAAVAAAAGQTTPAVLDEAAEHVREMSATHHPRVMDGWHRLGRWMLRGYDQLVDEEALDRIRKLDRDHSLVFLISHRSYLDEWVLPPALVEFGLTPAFGFAGANLDFFPLGTVARRTGIVHIRRATSGAAVYKFALRAFIGQLVADRSNLIWSIEGGRSRTGKLRPPRMGLLRYVVDAVEDLDGNDVLFVPVSIIYDQLPNHEVELMTSEARGQGKTPENARWFAGYLRGLRHRLGHVYVGFGEPLALREWLHEFNGGPAGDPDRHAVERIALEVSHRINQATPVTPTAAVCVAMLGADRALTLDEILTTVEPLAEYLRARSWPIAGGASLHDKATIRRAAQDLVKSGVLTSFTGASTVWGVGVEQHLIASVYRNNAIHVFVLRAILELVLVSVASGAVTDPWAESLRLRELLKFEFFFANRTQFGLDLQFEMSLVDPDLRGDGSDLRADEAQGYLKVMDLLVAHLVLRPYFDAYAIVAEQLLDLGASTNLDEPRFMAECLALGRQWALQRRVANAESVSVEMFQTALRLARHRGLVDSEAPDLSRRRQEFVDELRATRDQIDRIARLAADKAGAGRSG